MGFMLFKSTALDSRFQLKNGFSKMSTESKDITKKVSKIGLPNQTSKIWHILTDISVLGACFSKPIFALKPLVQAGRFEYHEPHKWNKFLWLIKDWYEPKDTLFNMQFTWEGCVPIIFNDPNRTMQMIFIYDYLPNCSIFNSKQVILLSFNSIISSFQIGNNSINCGSNQYQNIFTSYTTIGHFVQKS